MKAEQGKWAEAIEAFLTMPEPGSRIYFNIASMYLRLGDLAAAEDVSFEFVCFFRSVSFARKKACVC